MQEISVEEVAEALIRQVERSSAGASYRVTQADETKAAPTVD
jgi:hypothetical protein